MHGMKKLQFSQLIFSLYSRFVPESLVWLISKGRIDEAEKILKKAAKFNNKTLPPNPLTGNTNHSTSSKEEHTKHCTSGEGGWAGQHQQQEICLTDRL